MALCAYCGKVDVAWRQIGRNWVACYAKKDANGVIVKAEVRSGEKTVMRPVPVPDAPHYPVKVSPAIYDGRDAGTYGTWCPEWTAEKAAKAIPRGKGKRQQPAPLPPLMPITPAGLGIVGLDGMPVPRPTPAPAPAPPTPPAPPPYIVPYVGSPVDYERLRGETRAEVVKILDEYGVKPPVAELHIIGPDGRVKVDGQFHAQVPALISRLARGKHVYLYGGAGAGKTHAACQDRKSVV